MSSRFPNARFIGVATVGGNLFDLGEFPGLVTKPGSGLVNGEVYEIDLETLKQLDEFEAATDYFRKQVDVRIGENELRCWTYEPDHRVYSLANPISSGDWLEHLHQKGSEKPR